LSPHEVDERRPALRFLVIGSREGLRSWVPRGSVVAFVHADGLRTGVHDLLPSFDVVVLDTLGVPAGERSRWAREVLGHLLEIAPQARPIVRAPAGEAQLARDALLAGAWDVITPELDADDLTERAETAARLARAQSGIVEAPARAPSREAVEPPESAPTRARDREADDEEDDGEPIEMVGTSPEIRRVFSMIRRVAHSDVPVLITGESGTGKELTALAIHERSLRSEGPFVPINCAAIPETLLEAELFGYERGAFTGASETRPGRLEAAQGGTLFLDEVGDVAPLLQVKLLRFLQDHRIERVGGRTPISLDVRILAATNRDLHALVADGRFREDLYYRLAVVPIHMPPLRDRGDDVILIARHCLERYARESESELRRFSTDAIDAMLEAEWPGNLRELINRVRRAVVVAEGPEVTATDMGFDAPVPSSFPTLREARREAEARCIEAALERRRGNRAEAARTLGISRTQLYELMHRYGIGNEA
jgi:DNA-binding NtrC family response regulator